MLNQGGQLGVLYQMGEQVGGFFDWNTSIVMDYTTRDGFREYKPHKRTSALGYFIFEQIENNVFEAEFYSTVDHQLVLMDSGKVTVDLPDTHTLDRRLDAPISIRWL